MTTEADKPPDSSANDQGLQAPQISSEQLRHTCATLLLVRCVHPKYVQELLGHATVAITLDTYSRVIPGMGDHTARAMEDLFSQSRPNCRQTVVKKGCKV